MFSLIQLREKRQHFVRQILRRFIARAASLVRSSHRRHDGQLLSTRVRYQIHSLIEDGNLSWAQSLVAPFMRS